MSPGCVALEQRLEPIDRWIALLEDRIKILEARAAENCVYTSGLNSRICEIEDSELNAIDGRLDDLDLRITDVAKYYSDRIGLQETSLDRITDRLCRLESPASVETAVQQESNVTYYRCNACNPNDALPPCVAVLDRNLGAPIGCLYASSRASAAAAWHAWDR